MPYKSIGQSQKEIHSEKELNISSSEFRSVSLNRADTTYIDLGRIFSTHSSKPMTIGGWAKYTVGQFSTGSFFDYGELAVRASTPTWNFDYWYPSAEFTGLYYYIADSDWSNYRQWSTTIGGMVPDDSWHHYLMTSDGLNNENSVKFYLDGVLQSVVTDFLGDIPTIPGPSSNLYSGRTLSTGNDGLSDALQNDLYIIPFVCTLAEIQELYNEGTVPNIQQFSRWDDIKNHTDAIYLSFSNPTTLTSSDGIIDLTNNNRKGSGINFSSDSSLSTDYPGSS
jgi:hypothetical protein